MEVFRTIRMTPCGVREPEHEGFHGPAREHMGKSAAGVGEGPADEGRSGDACNGVSFYSDTETGQAWRMHRTGYLLVISQREGYQSIFRASARGYHQKLSTRARAIGHGNRGIFVRDLSTPDFPAVLLVEGIQIAVATANKHETAPRHHRAAPAVWRTQSIRQRDSFQHRMIAQRWTPFAQRCLPSDLAPVQIDRCQNRVRWRIKRKASGQGDGLTGARENIRIVDRYERIGTIVFCQLVQTYRVG